MPVIREYTNKPGYYIRTKIGNCMTTFQVSTTGVRWLEREGLGDGDEIDTYTLIHMVNNLYAYTGGGGATIIDEPAHSSPAIKTAPHPPLRQPPIATPYSEATSTRTPSPKRTFPAQTYTPSPSNSYTNTSTAQSTQGTSTTEFPWGLAVAIAAIIFIIWLCAGSPLPNIIFTFFITAAIGVAALIAWKNDKNNKYCFWIIAAFFLFFVLLSAYSTGKLLWISIIFIGIGFAANMYILARSLISPDAILSSILILFGCLGLLGMFCIGLLSVLQ